MDVSTLDLPIAPSSILISPYPSSVRNPHRSVDPDLAVNQLGHIMRQADATVGGRVTGQDPRMHPDSLRRQAHEILHRGTAEVRPAWSCIMPAADS